MKRRAGKREDARNSEGGRPRRRVFSSLTQRILIVNSLPLAVLVAGILYLGEYRENLVRAELAGLTTQAEIFAGALGEGSIGTHPDGSQYILPDIARPMLRRLVLPTEARALVFDADHAIVADSRLLAGQGSSVQVESLPPPQERDTFSSTLIAAYELLVSIGPARHDTEPFPAEFAAGGTDVRQVTQALGGELATARWSTPSGALVLAAVAPVQRFKQVLGAVLLTVNAENIDASVRAVRFDILRVSLVALAVTVLLSVYLAGTIVRPVRRLAVAADNVRRDLGRVAELPDFTGRRDEIGELSGTLRQMTDALWQRIVANERFAADVAHEIKNPLTSLRSAVETASRVRDPEQQKTLMAIIQDDVKRLDRLISDISDASRLDAELARGEMEIVDLSHLLSALVLVHQTTTAVEGAARIVYRDADGGSCTVRGIEDRLVQVFQNLLTNAQSFTPPGGRIVLTTVRDGREVVASVEDEGPGIPPESLESIFERFYSERPDGETFGRHSGLGLSISRQIVEAHGGSIHAENVAGAGGVRSGARFVVRIPAASANSSR